MKYNPKHIEVDQSVTDKVDIVVLIGRYVELHKKGRDWFGLCPFHAERTPSFSVSGAKQMFYCFGCGVGGDATKFLMEMEGLSFTEARERIHGIIPKTDLRPSTDNLEPHLDDPQIPLPPPPLPPPLLSEEGVALPPNVLGESVKGQTNPEDDKQTLRKALSYAVQIYHLCLKKADYAESARSYLNQRQITPKTVDDFQIGFVPFTQNPLVSFYQRRHFSLTPLKQLGLLTAMDKERFAGRLIIPIHDNRGFVVGLGGRLIKNDDTQPKYLNSTTSLLFQKGHHLFNWHRAYGDINTSKQLLLLEGYMDVITAWQAGIRNAIGVLGTSLGEEQLKRLMRLNQKANQQTRIVIAYDADVSGTEAAVKCGQQLYSRGAWVNMLRLPPGTDPDEFICTHGKDAFLTKWEEALDLVTFRLQTLRHNYNFARPDDCRQYLKQAVTLLVGVSPLEREYHLRELASSFDVPLSDLQMEFQNLLSQKKYHYVDKNVTIPAIVDTKGVSSYATPEAAERMLLACMMKNRAVTLWAKEQIGDLFPTDCYAALAAHLYAYYEKEQHMDYDAFTTILADNPTLQAKALTLARLDIPLDDAGHALRDCLFHLRSYPLMHAVEESEAELDRFVQEDGDTERALQMLIDTVALRQRQIVNARYTTRGYSKEAIEVGKRTKHRYRG